MNIIHDGGVGEDDRGTCREDDIKHEDVLCDEDGFCVACDCGEIDEVEILGSDACCGCDRDCGC